MFRSVFNKPVFNITKKYFGTGLVSKNNTMTSAKYETLSVSMPKPFVCMVQLNRPEKRNAMNGKMWEEIKQCFDDLSIDPECRVIILSAIGKMFCVGLDLQDNINIYQKLSEHEDVARKCKFLEFTIKKYQDSISSIEKCAKPVIASVHSACIGSGVDMICAADIRYCSSDAWFQIKEVDIGMAADVGTLQRFPKIIGSDSLVRELVYTARKFSASEALQCGFVSSVFDSQESLLNKSIEVGEKIANKSPVAVQSSKLSLVYSRDHSVQEGLEHIAMHNKTMLQSEDFVNAVTAQATRGDPPVFSKL
ncbi:delta(3,5)-Delta(2,4)-dienoyl-CoA isomerase, mitochondrial isoform X1 [Vespa crabro]|uniref:delta(3,5)-Delta(2,4)-dienoyl-CoA isomerase, mitochondrial isoform X1 n=1 Tax=Vespa crabro TaxID=7445 RepID=UPI001F00467B|nr:delta(3,5)-Delta(2,4)-dienoyl-CoA isomerase, mitochondrial isoform X1 [Vespa crabro]